MRVSHLNFNEQLTVILLELSPLYILILSVQCTSCLDDVILTVVGTVLGRQDLIEGLLR